MLKRHAAAGMAAAIIGLPSRCRGTRAFGGAILTAFLYLHLGAVADAEETDANIVTGVDVSTSVTLAEVQTQVEGIAIAIKSPEIIAAIQRGHHKRIGFAVFLWADGGHPLVVDWCMIGSAQDAETAAAEMLTRMDAARRTGASGLGLTDMSAAIEAGGALLLAAPFAADRSILNIIGDGEDNVADGPDAARNALVAAGIDINGVVLGNETGLPDYFRSRVIGGPMAFVLSIAGPENVVDAMRRKFITEIAMNVGNAADDDRDRAFQTAPIARPPRQGAFLAFGATIPNLAVVRDAPISDVALDSRISTIAVPRH